MKLYEFLQIKTQVNELCVIRDCGWIVATFWIDDEDLFCRYIHKELKYAEVKSDSWGLLSTINAIGNPWRIPCHYVDV